MTLRLFLRLFLIQALWNYRTMLGAGMAWVLLPVLRAVHGDDGERLTEGLSRQGTHFNAHPYLAGFAAGALAKMELEGVEQDQMERFRRAVAAPLGGLGDRLIWAAWLPACVLGAGALGLAGVPPLVVVAVFLVTFNLPHVVLRWWGVTAGLSLGRGVGQALGRGDLPMWSERVGRAGVLILGLVVGLLVAPGQAEGHLANARPDVLALCALGGVLLFTLGVRERRGTWWWTPTLIVATFMVLLISGGFPW